MTCCCSNRRTEVVSENLSIIILSYSQGPSGKTVLDAQSSHRLLLLAFYYVDAGVLLGMASPLSLSLLVVWI
nr:MAG TPA: hypothetical protein [Caudoviricetes sp.]